MARKTHISILQFDERTITRLRVKRSPKGVDCVSYDVESGAWSYSDGTLAEAVRTFARAHQLAEDSICTVLPRHEMTARILSLPTQSAVEIESMVQLSAEEYVPYPAHELVIDQAVLQKSGDGTSKVIAVFAHRDVVEAHVDVLRKCGIDPEHIYVSTACLASALQAARVEEQRYALVNLASGGVEVLVMENGRLSYGRGVAAQHNWNNLSRADSQEIEDLAMEVRASLSAYRRESEEGEGVDRIYVSSDYADCAAAANALAEATGYECAPAKFAASLFEHGSIPAKGLPLVSAGAALSAQGRGSLAISLVPASLVQARQTGELRRSLLKGGGLAAAVVLSALAVFGQAYYQRASYSGELQNRIDAIKETAETARSRHAQLLRLQQNLDRRGSALELLAAVIELMPRGGMTITRFAYAHNDALTIQGRAESQGLATDLADAMRAAGAKDIPQFARVRGGAFKQEMEQDRQVWQFEIIVPLAPEEVTEEGEASNE
ncbi:MAG: pilus assembly protein PilM [Candidatus Hydrogenedentes bacterium]|nr:pilus assembly protein PilM [Candidatus Hydrogenedentota bacterium]